MKGTNAHAKNNFMPSEIKKLSFNYNLKILKVIQKQS